MMKIEKEYINDIPVLLVAKEESRQEKRPLLIFYHGFTSAKEHNLHYAYYLAERGFRVALPDAKLHGERSKGYNQKQLSLRFWNIVMKSIAEAESIKEALVKKGLVDEDRIGMAGTSMGAITMLGAMTQYDWIKAGASMMGSPVYVQFAKYQVEELRKYNYELPYTKEELNHQFEMLEPYDLSLAPDKLKGRPLFFWHGRKDVVVPFHYAYEFYTRLKERHEDEGQDLTFIDDLDAGHQVTRAGVLQMVQWLLEKV